jgi:transcriptional regulator with XRE-family HTH domain
MRLRELRQHAGLTGRQLAESLSWPPSKISKLENGRQTPTDDDIRDWTQATASEPETSALLASLHTLEVQHAEWQRQLKPGLRSHQNEIARLDARTKLFRVFEATVIPGIIQTPDYARYRLAQGPALFHVPDDVDAAVEARAKRQDILYRRDKRFHFILTEAALRLRLCPPEVMLTQLDRLISISALPNIRLGIIGFGTTYSVAPWHGFWLLDNDLVMVETYSAELNLAQPREISLYATIFNQLAATAAYGRPARAIITSAIENLAAETPDDVA